MHELRTMIGNRIRTCREALGLTQEQLAERVQVNTSYLSQIERGMKVPSLVVLQRIAAGLNTTLGELLVQDEPATPAPLEREVARMLESVPEDRRHALLDLIRSAADLASR